MKSTKFLVLSFVMINFIFFHAQNISLVKDINLSGNSNPYSLNLFNNKMYFVANGGSGYKLFSSDGTNVGTQLVGPSVGSGNLYPIINYNNEFFFNYDDGITGPELWKSDGTTAGTVLVKDITPGISGSNPQFITGTNGKVFFIVGSRLWVSDGTNAGTIPLTSTANVAASFNNQSLLTSYNNEVYFSGIDNSGLGLWKSDGITASLVKNIRVNSYNKGSAILNNTLYFAAGDSNSDNELYKTDGTTAGTVLVKNINPSSGSEPNKFIKYGNRFLFLANDGTTGEELWISDGTSGGTTLVKDIVPGTASSNIQTLVEYNNQIYFFVLNNSNRILYKSDGTEAGTVPIKTIPFMTAPYAYVFNGKLYFLAQSIGSSFLFESDGTPNGTLQINPAISSENYSDLNFITYNNNLYLPCYYTGYGLELCKYISTNMGTQEISTKKDITIYPNPTQDVFNLSNIDHVKTIKITDSSSRLVKTINNPTITIRISELNSGIYFAELLLKDGTTKTIKIIKN